MFLSLQIPKAGVHEENTPRMKKFDKMIKHEAHFGSVLQGFSEAFVTGKFCDVKVVCKVGAAAYSLLGLKTTTFKVYLLKRMSF